MRLKGKVAILTGAGGGMGEGIATCLVQEGAHLVASDIDLDSAQARVSAIEAAGGRASRSPLIYGGFRET